MCQDLNQNLVKHKSKLLYFYGDVITVLKSINQEVNIDAVFLNQDYTPYSKKRDLGIEEFCNQNQIIYQKKKPS